MQQLNTAVNLIIDGAEIAALLHKSPKTFRNLRPLLHAAGMPQPLSLPGNPVWLASEIDAWLHSRSPQTRPAYELSFSPPGPQQIKRGRGRPRKNPLPAAGGAQ